jgi:hypothetical protein
MQNTSHLLMIQPVQFGFNHQTAVNNAFQQNSGQPVQQAALIEFNDFVNKLRAEGVNVLVVEDTLEPYTPDSIFPNNWISFHEDGSIVLYPMYAANRRAERKQTVLDAINKHFKVNRTISYTEAEDKEVFLEGTGSMVLDRTNKIAYACISERTHYSLLTEWCNQMGYKACTFTSTDKRGMLVYHTNVMMCVADTYVVVCLDSIASVAERAMLETTIVQSGKKIFTISLEQMDCFAGNMLQVQNNTGKKILVMSTQAWQALTTEQQNVLENYNAVLHSALFTIEQNGGGSARCMMAEIFLPTS